MNADALKLVFLPQIRAGIQKKSSPEFADLVMPFASDPVY